MKLQDWQKKILEMTEGQELAPLFKPKKKNVKKTKSKTKQTNIMTFKEYFTWIIIMLFLGYCITSCKKPQNKTLLENELSKNTDRISYILG